MNSIAMWMAAVAGLVCAVVVVLVAGDVYAPLGDSDPGLVTTSSVVVVRFLATCAGMVTTGALAFAAFVVPRAAAPGEALTADAYAAVRTAAVAASAWVVAAVAMVPLSAADSAGRPLSEVWAVFAGLVDASEEPKAWLCVVAAAAVVAAGTRATLAWPPLILWLVVAVVGLVAPVVAGHVAAVSGTTSRRTPWCGMPWPPGSGWARWSRCGSSCGGRTRASGTGWCAAITG